MSKKKGVILKGGILSVIMGSQRKMISFKLYLIRVILKVTFLFLSFGDGGGEDMS